MLPGDAGIVQIDVRRLAPAQDVLPVGQGQGRAVWQAQLAPVLRRVGNPQQRADRPVQDQHGQSRKQKAHKGHIPLPRQRMCRQQGRQVIQQPLQNLHGSASSLETQLHSLLL